MKKQLLAFIGLCVASTLLATGPVQAHSADSCPSGSDCSNQSTFDLPEVGYTSPATPGPIAPAVKADPMPSPAPASALPPGSPAPATPQAVPVLKAPPVAAPAVPIRGQLHFTG